MLSTTAPTRPTDYLRELWRRREFAYYLALGNLRARNASTALGLLWWVLNPLLLGSIYLLVFGVIFEARRGQPAYLSFLLSGLFAFYYTRGAMVGGANSITSNAKLLANQRFPRLLLPLSALIEASVGFLFSLVAFFAITWPVDRLLPGSAIVWLVPAVGLHAVFNFGVAAITARLVVPFRDVNNLVPYLLRLWLYLSPIIYSIDRVPEAFRGFFMLNPLVPILALYRTALMGAPIDASTVQLAAGWAFGLAALGVWLFVRFENRMVRYL